MNCQHCKTPDIEKERIWKHENKKHLCFSCGVWTELVEKYWSGTAGVNGHIACVVDGHHYVFTPGIFTPARDCGMGGALYKMTVNGVEYETNNLWHQGEIPPAFLNQLPDNATREAVLHGRN